MPVLFMEPGEALEIVLDCDLGNENPTVWEVELITPGAHARMLAMIAERRRVHLEAGGRPTDPEVAVKEKEAEMAFVAGFVRGARNFPKLGTLKGAEQVLRGLRGMPIIQYDDLLNKMISAEGIDPALAKSSGSRS
jgi:hypothetical protein